MRGSGSRAVGRIASFEGDDRLGAFAGSIHELGSVFDAFDVKSNTGSVFVFVQVSDEISKIEVSLVADGDHLIKTDTAGIGGSSHGDQQGAALRDQGSLAIKWQIVIERSVHLVTVGENTDDVRTNDAHAVFTSDRNDFVFESVVADFAETGGNNADTLHAFFTCIAGDGCYKTRGNCDDSHIHHIRDILDVGVALVTENFFGVRIDRVDRVLVTAVFQVLNYFISDFFGVGRRADDCDALWF